MPKLHELLAVEANFKAQADKTRAELMSTFEKKTHHFTEKTVSFRPFEEGHETVVESQLDLQTTVPQEIRWLSTFIIQSLDASRAIAEANTFAKADVVLEDGTVLLKDVPATSLLELTKRADELQHFVNAIPTLDPAKGFQPDPARGADVYKAREDKQVRTKKTNKVVVLYPHTEKHPAQVQVVDDVVPVGEITKLEWSGLITPAAKSQLLSRVEDFTRAVKKARSRANEAEIPKDNSTIKIGGVIYNYIFNGSGGGSNPSTQAQGQAKA